MIVIISISYVVCLCLDFLLSFVSSWFAFTRDVLYKERKLVSLFGDLEGLSFPAMKESMIFNIVLLSKQYRKDLPPSGYDSFFFFLIGINITMDGHTINSFHQPHREDEWPKQCPA